MVLWILHKSRSFSYCHFFVNEDAFLSREENQSLSHTYTHTHTHTHTHTWDLSHVGPILIKEHQSSGETSNTQRQEAAKGG